MTRPYMPPNPNSIPMQPLGNPGHPSSSTQAASPIDPYLTPEGEAEIGALLRNLNPDPREAAQLFLDLHRHLPQFFNTNTSHARWTALDLDMTSIRRRHAVSQQLAEALAAHENSSSNTEPPSPQDLQKFEKILLLGETGSTTSDILETAIGYALKQFGFSVDINANSGIGMALMHVTAQLNLETKNDSVVDHLMTIVLALLTKNASSKETKIAAEILEKYVVPTYRALNTVQKAKVDMVCQVVFQEALEKAEKNSKKPLPKFLRDDDATFISGAIALGGFITMVIGLSCHALYEVIEDIEENRLEARKGGGKGGSSGSSRTSGDGSYSGSPNLLCQTRQTAMSGAVTGGVAIALSILGLLTYRLAKINNHRQERAKAGQMANHIRRMLPASEESAGSSQPQNP